MPGRRTPQHRGGTPVGGSTPVAVGSLVLSESVKLYGVYAGDAPASFEGTSDRFTLSNGGPGNWSNPQYSIAYDDAKDWLSLSPENVAGEFVFTVTIDGTSLTESVQTATVTFTDTRVSNSGLAISLVLTVSAANPTMSVFPSTLNFSIVDETSSGTAQVTTVSNATGVGTLASPTVGTITGAGAAYIDSVDVTGSSPGPYTVTVTPTATGGTVGGPYQALIPLASTGALNTPITLTANITVTSAQTAVIGLDRTLDDAQFIIGGANPGTQSVGFRNEGTGTFAGVTVQSTTYGGVASGWGTATIANNTLSVAIDTAGIVDEGFSTLDVVLADANAAATATYTVFLKSQNAVLSPVLNVSPGAIGLTVNNGSNPSDRTITIQNVNGSIAQLGTIGVTLSPGVSWCSVTSVVNGVATLAFTTGALANATYNTSAVVTASLATNSPISVPISVTVQAPPTPGSYPPGPQLAALPQGWTYDQNVGHPVGSCFNDGGYAGAADGVMPSFSGTVFHCPADYTITEITTLLGNGGIVDGDIVEIEAGQSFAGVQWPVRPGWVEGTSGFVWIRSSGYASLPAYQGEPGPNKFTTDNRAKDAHAALMFSLTSSSASNSTLMMQRGASGYWFTGVRFYNSFTSATSNASAIVSTGGHVGTSVSQSQLSHRPSHLVLDRCIFRAAQSAARAINAGATYCRIVQCSMPECYKNNGEFQSILFLNGGDRTDILGNSLNGWGEILYSGGGTPGIKDFSPSNICAMWNYMWGDPSHSAGPDWSDDAKNGTEFKTGWQAFIGFNRYTGLTYKADQKFTLLTKATDQTEIVNGQKVQSVLFPAHTHDITFWCNDISRSVGKCFVQITDNVSDVASSATIGTERIEVAWNKHFYDANVPAGNGKTGPIIPSNNDRLGINIIKSQGDGIPGVHVYHNTFAGGQAFWTCTSAANNGPQWSNIAVSNNVSVENPQTAVVFGSSSGNNTQALNANFGAGNWDCRKNFIMPGPRTWDSTLITTYGNGYLGSGGLTGNFVDPNNATDRDLTLIIPAGQPASVYDGTDGRQAGYDHTYMEEMLQGIEAD